MRLLLSAFLVLSFSASAEVVKREYTGSNNGQACTLRISIDPEHGDRVSLDGCSAHLPTNVRLVPKDGKLFVPRDYGHLDEKDCTIEVTLNKMNEPTKAKMSAGGFFSPILLPKLTCRNLVQIK